MLYFHTFPLDSVKTNQIQVFYNVKSLIIMILILFKSHYIYMNILGISAFYHDSAACLVRDVDGIAVVQEERFTRKKHDHSFPLNAIKYHLKNAVINEYLILKIL